MTKKTIQNAVGNEYYRELEPLLPDEDELPELILKSPRLGMVLSICLGVVGIDRLYQGSAKMMGAKLLMNILSLGAWYFPDIYYCRQAIYMSNYMKVKRILGY